MPNNELPTLLGCATTGAGFVPVNDRCETSVTGVYAIGEVTGVAHSLDRSPAQEPLFYGVYVAVLALAGVAVALGAPVVKLSVAVQVMNALLLPLVLGFLFLLARQLPEPHRLAGARCWVTGTLMLLVSALGLAAGLGGGAG